jgi:3-oxoacyl-[acyl-carrier protein] reductase
LHTFEEGLFLSFMPQTPRLAGKRALVTAGAQGIGLAISRHLLAAGCDVFVHYYSSADSAGALAREAAALGRRCGSVHADLTEPEECGRVVAEAVAFLGGLDILVNNAGSLVARRSLAKADDDFWAAVMSLNLGSTRRVTRAAEPHLTAAAKSAGGASIINISSIAGRKGGHPGSLAYATAKGAVLTFSRALAAELGPNGVRVNAIAPGLILGSSFHATHTTPEAARATIAGIPLGRAGNTDDVARAVVFLASEFDGFVTGVTLDLNGGSYMA